jgi:predicted transcriptional regulator
LRSVDGLEVDMKSVEIEVLRPKAALQAFKRTWRQTERGEAVMPRLAFGSWAEVFSAITEKRVELIGYVTGREQINTRQLAQALGRDYKNVYTDVQALVQIGLLDKDSRGRISAPYDEIVIRAELRDVLRSSRTKRRNPATTVGAANNAG